MFNGVKAILKGFLGKGSSFSQVPEGIPLHKFSDYGSFIAAGTGKVWSSFKACDTTALAALEAPLQIVNGKGDVIENPQIQALLDNPNETFNFSELIYLSIMHLKMTGNAFWYKSEANLKGDKPRSLIPLNPKRVKIVPTEDGIRGYLLKTSNQDIPFDPEEIIHFKRPHPDNDYWGIGDIEAAQEVFNEHINRTTWGKTFWKNGASPSSVLICEDQVEDEVAWEKAKRKFHAEYGGAKNAGKTAWLTGKWTYQQVGMSAVDMQDLEKSKLTEEQIFLAHGVPLSVAGVRDAANYATAEIDDVRFRRYTVAPLLRLIGDALSTDLFAGYNPALKAKFALGGLIPITKIVQDMTPLFDRGIVSINEIRERLGMDAKADPMFETHFVNAGLVPLDLAGIGNVGQIEDQSRQLMADFVRRTLIPTPDPFRNGEHQTRR